MINHFITKYLVWVLAAWIGSWCVASPTAGVAAERSPAGVTSVDYRSADLVTSASMPGRRGNGDNPIVLDDPEAVDSDAAALTDLEDLQVVALTGDAPYQGVAVYERPGAWCTASFVEPRFLRYSRLLN